MNNYTNLEDLERAIKDINERKKSLISQRKEVEAKDSARMGKLLRKAFGKAIPIAKAEQDAFIDTLYKLYLDNKDLFVFEKEEETVAPIEEKPSATPISKPEVSAEPAAVHEEPTDAVTDKDGE